MEAASSNSSNMPRATGSPAPWPGWPSAIPSTRPPIGITACSTPICRRVSRSSPSPPTGPMPRIIRSSRRASHDAPEGGLAMNPAIADLLAPASFRLSTAEAVLPPFVESAAGPLAGELQALLRVRNGFYAFSNALHVFPAVSSDLSWGLEDWNMPGLWKHEYESFVDPALCFAQDPFANQFSIKGAPSAASMRKQVS